MILLPYLLKVMLCSAILMVYYYAALRNKLFHQWNRFYLLATIVLSLCIPCFTYTIKDSPKEVNSQVIQLLQVVTINGSYEQELPLLEPAFTKEHTIIAVYCIVSAILFISLLLSLSRIASLIRQHEVQRIDKVRLLFADVKGTPFSFFNFLFWNRSIDMNAETGHQIFQHELAHIEQKHTLDKLLLQLVLIGFWCNPVFWIIRNELRMVHEFSADKKAVQHQDASALAAMILLATYPKQYSALINPFFNQSIKRRIQMLTKIQNPTRNYISRILFLPIAVLVTMAFTVRVQPSGKSYMQSIKQALPFTVTNKVEGNTNHNLQGDIPEASQPLDKIYAGKKKVTVVIDAGHGGDDLGARNNDINEKDITLAIAKEIQAVNANPNIEIVFTRADDGPVKLVERVKVAENSNAVLFVSLHTGAVPITTAGSNINYDKRGFQVFVPKDTVSYVEQSKLLGSALLQQLNTVKTVPANMQLLQQQMNIWVLNKNTCPSVLIECGYITNEKDRKFFQQAANQKVVAQRILRGIEAFLQAKETNLLPVKTVTETGSTKGPSKKEAAVAETKKDSKATEEAKPSDVKTNKETSYTGDIYGWKNFLFQATGTKKEGC